MDNLYELTFQAEATTLEESRVTLMLRVFGLQDWLGPLRDEHRRLTGERGLSLRAFDQLFPGFPICLEARPLYRLVEHSTCSQAAMFRNFRRYVPYEQFLKAQDALAESAQGRPIGLLYRWEGLRDGLIIHNGDFPTQGFKQTYTHGPTRVTVEPFARLVRTLAATKWTLESLRAPNKAIAVADEPLPIPSPWKLFELVRDEAEFQLLALLVEILFVLPPGRCRRFIVRRGGERWVALTQERMAIQLHCSVRKVQRAVAAVAKKGLVETRRNDRGEKEIRLCLPRLMGKELDLCQTE